MSLQVWLPLNGNINNYGILGPLTQTTAPSFGNGKLGKGMTTGGCKMSASQTSSVLNNNDFSICFWVYINADTGTTNGNMFFGTDSMGANNNRKFSVCNYPTVNDLHLSWQNDTANECFYVSILEGVIPSYKWTHVAVTYKNPNISIYINGKKTATGSGVSNSSSFAYETQVLYNSSYMIRNDFRIYDNCLSAKEVKEISKGLVLNYKLSGIGKESLLIKSNISNRGCSTFSYDAENNLYNCIAPAKSSDWGYGITFNLDNSNKINVPKGQTLCFSLKVKPNVDCSCVADVNNATTDGSNPSGNDNDDLSSRTAYGFSLKANVWNEVYWTYTAKTYDLYDSNSNWGIVTTNASSSISFQLKDVKIEYGKSPTPWVPNKNDVLYSQLGFNSNIEPDCSGLGNDGAINGNIVITDSSPRHSTCYNMTTNSTYIQRTLNTSGIANSYTIAYWAKISDMTNKMVWGFSDGNRLNVYPSGGAFCWNTGDGANNPFKNNGTIVSYSEYNGGWHHYTITGDGTTTTLYIDGVKVGTANAYKAITGSNIIISGWDTGTEYKWVGGCISDFRIYGTALNADDVKQLYNIPASITNTGTLLAYEFNEV